MDLVHVSEDRWTVVLTFKENNKDVNVAVWSVEGNLDDTCWFWEYFKDIASRFDYFYFLGFNWNNTLIFSDGNQNTFPAEFYNMKNWEIAKSSQVRFQQQWFAVSPQQTFFRFQIFYSNCPPTRCTF